MNKFLFIFATLLLTTIVLFSLFSGPSVLAVSGCCKDRSTYSGRWQRVNKNYDQCKVYNDQRDGDNVFDERGYVWWDSRCR